MADLTSERTAFDEWVAKHKTPAWSLLPLTHVTKGLIAEDIFRAGRIDPRPCPVFGQPLAYFFYGRPSYRVAGDGAIKAEAACPFCFIFDGSAIADAKAIFPFDTGAYEARLYRHAMSDEMRVGDFALAVNADRPNQLIFGAYGTVRAYFDGDMREVVSPEDGATPWEMHARAYLELVSSKGRNEPDDRISSVEILFDNPVLLPGDLRAVVVPHTFWSDGARAPWLVELATFDVEILPYQFVPGRPADYYYAHLEAQVRGAYERWGLM